MKRIDNQRKASTGPLRQLRAFGAIATLLATTVTFAGTTDVASAMAPKCDSSQIDLSRAKRSNVKKLKGVNAKAAKQFVTLRKQGQLEELEDLRILELSDRRFLALLNDTRSCFEGRSASELLPRDICGPSDVRLNSSNTRSLARLIGRANAARVVDARPIDNLKSIARIPERGKEILSLLGRRGGTCLDNPAPPAAATTMGDGTFEIGVDIAAGRYLATDVQDCSWERSSTDALIAERFIDQAEQTIVDIKATDVLFTSDGCGTWALAGDSIISTLLSIPGDGDWLVTTQLKPGIYRATEPVDCAWERQRSLEGVGTDQIDSGQLANGLTLIEVEPTDIAFSTSRCGVWESVLPECMSQLEAVHPAVPEEAPHIYGVSDSVLLSTQWEMEMAMTEFSFNWGGFGGLNTRDAPPIVEIEIGEGKVTGTTVIVGLGHNYRGEMVDDFPGYIDTMIATFPAHVDRVIWVAPSRFNTLMPDVVTMLTEATERWPQMEVADFWIEGDAQNHPEWFEDDLHHDAVGRTEIANYLNDKLLFPCG